ncbi:hypothetical protein ACPXA0_26555, partial [Escherichia coli]|uniref:hypothetical protein n=1 Tax=Escherichia coli TaxID=562 RepID=UPI003CE58CC4
HDNTSETGDDIYQMRSQLWSTLSDAKERNESFPASNLLDFVDDWNDNSYTNLDNILYLNKIIKKVADVTD